MERKTRFFTICTFSLCLLICIFATASAILYLMYTSRVQADNEACFRESVQSWGGRVGSDKTSDQDDSEDKCSITVKLESERIRSNIIQTMDKRMPLCTSWYDYVCGGYLEVVDSSWEVLRDTGRRVYSDTVTRIEKRLYNFISNLNAAQSSDDIANQTMENTWPRQAKLFYDACLASSSWTSNDRLQIFNDFFSTKNLDPSIFENNQKSKITKKSILSRFTLAGFPLFLHAQSAASFECPCPIINQLEDQICAYFTLPTLRLDIEIEEKTKIRWIEKLNTFFTKQLSPKEPSIRFLQDTVKRFVEIHFSFAKIYTSYYATHSTQPHAKIINATRNTKLNWNCEIETHRLLEYQMELLEGIVAGKVVYLENQDILCYLYNRVEQLSAEDVYIYSLWDTFIHLQLSVPNNFISLKRLRLILTESISSLVHKGYELDDNLRRCVLETYILFRPMFRDKYRMNENTQPVAQTMLKHIQQVIMQKSEYTSWIDEHTKPGFDAIVALTTKNMEYMVNGFPRRSVWFPNFDNATNYLNMLNIYMNMLSASSLRLIGPITSIFDVIDLKFSLFRMFFHDGVIMDDRLINVNYPSYWNYAIFGYLVSYEYAHQLQTSKASIFYHLETTFPDSTSESDYLMVRQCFLNRAIRVKASNITMQNMFVAGDISDYFGVTTALNAMRSFLESSEGKEELSCGWVDSSQNTYEQLFFIRVSQNFCEMVGASQHENIYVSKPMLSCYTNPGKYRAESIFHQIRQISKIFHCHPRDYKNKPCTYWTPNFIPT